MWNDDSNCTGGKKCNEATGLRVERSMVLYWTESARTQTPRLHPARRVPRPEKRRPSRSAPGPLTGKSLHLMSSYMFVSHCTRRAKVPVVEIGACVRSWHSLVLRERLSATWVFYPRYLMGLRLPQIGICLKLAPSAAPSAPPALKIAAALACHRCHPLCSSDYGQIK